MRHARLMTTVLVALLTSCSPKSTDTAGTPPGSVQTAPITETIAAANRLLSKIRSETSEQYTPVFLYESSTYRKVVDDICGHKELFFAAAEQGLLDSDEFFVAWQAMEHLPLMPYLHWMGLFVDNFKEGQCDYRALHKILFPSLNENGEYYFHFKDPAVAAFYTKLGADTGFRAALGKDNSLAPYGGEATSDFDTQVNDLLSGKTWELVKQEIMACQIVPSHAPRDRDCPTTTIREKEKPPKWWKVKCDGAFGETPIPDTYWSGPGSDAPWWDKTP
jgi:hypothetical protein